ncbi:MAG: hypothetical protein HYS43_00660 [Candidatus Liptonbacteria bacterium]|nr:hypothetical protein [Candidatus Liptonbacteria bacterium]
MTLATHAVVGAAAASFFPTSPVLAAGAAFASHFLIDAIPHGHYGPRSLRKGANRLDDDMPFGKSFLIDLLLIGTDFTIGIAFVFFIFQNTFGGVMIPLIGALAGVLPDFLQFAYWKTRREPLTSFQRFHLWSHTKREMSRNHAYAIGIESALIIASAAIVFLA